ncbi:MAG TPA: Smr/MutS family protein, partial [Xanthomonadales bacterium]
MDKKIIHQILDDPLFRQEMAGVVPLKSKPTTDSKPPRKPVHRHKQDVYPENPDTSQMATADDPAHINAEDGSSHRKNGIQNRTMQKLKRGRFRIGAELDLHSMTMETAHAALLEFIADAKTASMETVRVIHGKGLRSENGPRLKQMT